MTKIRLVAKGDIGTRGTTFDDVFESGKAAGKIELAKELLKLWED